MTIAERISAQNEGKENKSGSCPSFLTEVFANHSCAPHHQAFSAARRPLLEPNSFHITIWNSEVNEGLTELARAFVKTNIN